MKAFKNRIATLPRVERVTKLEQAERMMEVIRSPMDYRNSLKFYLHVERQRRFRSPVEELYEVEPFQYVRVLSDFDNHFAEFMFPDMPVRTDCRLVNGVVQVGTWRLGSFRIWVDARRGDVYRPWYKLAIGC